MIATLAETGGVARYLGLLLPALTACFDVVVAAYGSGPLEEAALAAGAAYAPLRHLRRDVSPFQDALALFELVRLTRRVRPDILHANSAKAGLLGRMAAAATGVPIRIFAAHGWAFATHPGRSAALYLWAERLMRPLTDVVVCVSESERARGLAARACTAGRTVVIPNGIEAAAEPSVRDGETAPLIVSVGRLKAPKDFVTLVRALARLDRGSFRAVVVGDGPDRPLLERELRRLGLTDAVTLAGERRDVPELLGRSDVFVLSSSSEAMPMSVLEAMAAGLPVVASDVGGVPELVRADTGVLFRAGDPDALAAALERLIADPSLRRGLGATGRIRARERFGVEAFRRAYVDLYRGELAARGLPLPAL